MDKSRRPTSVRAIPLPTRATVALCVLCWGASLASAQERFKPSQTHVVLPTSVHAGSDRQAAWRTLDKAWRAQPQDLSASLAYARAVFTLGLTEGDLRWYGSAKAALSPWWHAQNLPAEAYFLRGLVKQGFHDFHEGLQDIERAIALEPGRPELWSWRFALHLLLADMRAAEQDADEIARRFGDEEALVYRAVLRYRSGQPLDAVDMLSRAIRWARFQDDSSQDWLSFHRGEAHRVAGQPARALEVWGQRLKVSPQSHLIRLSLAELLNQQGQFKQAKTIAMATPGQAQSGTAIMTDALLMQALLASRGLKDADESRLAQQFEARQQSQGQRQESLIERPALIYQISYGRDVKAGLALSIQNWQLQKEPPDALLFVQAALAQGQARAAEPVLNWAQKSGYTDPQLKPLLAQLQSHPSWTGGRP